MEKEKTTQEGFLAKLSAFAEKLSAFSKTEEEAAKVELQAEAKKQDGTIVYTDADEFAPGVSVFIKEGEEVLPAPDGEHVLEDGSVVVVADGAVESIKEAEAEEEEMSEEGEKNYVTRKEVGALMQDLYDALNLSAEALKEVSNGQAEKVQELTSQIEKLTGEKEELETKLSQPAADSVTKSTKQAEKVEKMSKAEWASLSAQERIKNYKLNPNIKTK